MFISKKELVNLRKLREDFRSLASSLQRGIDRIQNPRIRDALAETERELILILGGTVRLHEPTEPVKSEDSIG